MKTLFLTSLIILLCLELKAQNTYSNKIGEVKELNVYGKDANIIIGKIIVNNSITPPSIRLLESFQSPTVQKDGFYLTEFAFGTDNVLPLYNVNLKLKFNSHIDTLKEYGIGYEMAPSNAINGLAKDSVSYSHVGSEVHAMINGKAVFIVYIRSKEKIQTTINGASN